MKKAFVLCASALVICIAAGVLLLIVQHSQVSRSDRPIRNTMAAASTAAAQPSASPTPPACDDDQLLALSGQVLDALAQQDFQALGGLVHPTRGVTFTPYSTVEPEFDLCFLPDQIAKAGEDATTYNWGFTDGRGSHISMTIPDYFGRYVYDADYRTAPQVSLDQVMASGNALENVSDVFTGCRFVEYYFPQRKPENNGLDWCALKVVFAPAEDGWYLVGLIHSEWTI